MSGAPGPYSVRPFKRHAKAVPEWAFYDGTTGEHDHTSTYMDRKVADRFVRLANLHADELADWERADARSEPFS